MTDRPTAVKVRIALAINADGDWDAQGNADWEGDYSRNEVATNIDYPTIYWVTAEIPIPGDQEVAGAVEADVSGEG